MTFRYYVVREALVFHGAEDYDFAIETDTGYIENMRVSCVSRLLVTHMVKNDIYFTNCIIAEDTRKTPITENMILEDIIR